MVMKYMKKKISIWKTGPSICLKGVLEVENREASEEEISKEIMVENISELKKESTHYGAEQDLKTEQYF